MIRKKDGSIRFCVDYMKLNADKQKTAFSIGNGLWQFTIMPFGLCNAPTIFERLMKKVLKELLINICLVNLDDVIIFGESFEDMLNLLRQDFSTCGFSAGITTDPEKISTIENWPVPRTKKQIYSFLGFCSYYTKFARWHVGLEGTQQYNFKVIHQREKFHGNIDGLSRLSKWKSPNFKNCVFQIIIPQKRVKEILEEAHDSSLGGHFEINKTLEKIWKKFYWATCKQDVENWCRSCRICIAKKRPSDKRSKMQIYNAGVPFERIQIDKSDHISLRWLMSFKNLEGQMTRTLAGTDSTI
ncbi:hypothetical protein ACFW04_013744 [Cataglyphis niger]